jgi:hypothetical protein
LIAGKTGLFVLNGGPFPFWKLSQNDEAVPVPEVKDQVLQTLWDFREYRRGCPVCCRL